MSHFSWARASYVMFGLAVFAALIKLWSPAISTSESLAAKDQTNSEAPLTSTRTVEPDIEQRKPSRPGTRTPGQEYFVRHTLDLPDRKEPPTRKQRDIAPGSIAPPNEPPVFYRPPAEDSGGGALEASGPVCGDLGDLPKSNRVVFPLQDDYFNSYDDTWGAPRPQGGHEGTDLMTPSGVPEYAITDGTVVPVSGSEEGWNTLGGYTVMVRADYDFGPVREGDLFYYAHMDRESALPTGSKVRAGQVLGYSGDTGQGSEVTRGLFPPHLHLGWYDGSGDRSDLESGAMDPYPLLEWLKRNGGSVVGGSGAEYCEAPRTKDAPSPQAEQWPATPPGKSPDLDTGTKDPRPSPAVKKPPSAAPVEKSSGKRAGSDAGRHKKARVVPQKARAARENTPAAHPKAPKAPKSQRRSDQPDPPKRNRVSRKAPPKDRTKAELPTAKPSERKKVGGRQDIETSPKKTESNDPASPGTGQNERPAKPKTSKKGGCTDANCPAGPGDSETTVKQPDSATTTSEDGKAESTVEAVPAEGEGGTTGKTTGVP